MRVLSLLPAPRVQSTPLPAGWAWVFQDRGAEEAALRDADFLLAGAGEVGERLLRDARRLKLIQMVGAGYDNVDMAAARRRGIPVCNNPGHNAQAVAEYVLMAILFLARRIGEGGSGVWDGEFAAVKQRLTQEPVRELGEIAVGILGMGRTGQAVAQLLHRVGVGKLCSWARRPIPDAVRALGCEEAGSLQQLLAAVDVVTIHLPLTAETHGLLDGARLGQMRRGSILINAARGGIVDEEAVARMVERGHLQGVALDVYAAEPPAATHPVLGLPGLRPWVLATPHMAGVTSQSWAAMVEEAVANMQRVALGGLPRNLVTGP